MISIIVAIAIAGLIVWAITYVIPMPAVFQRAIYAVCVVCLVLFALQKFGLIHTGVGLWK